MSTWPGLSSERCGLSAVLAPQARRGAGGRRAPRVLVGISEELLRETLPHVLESSGFDATVADSADDLLLQCDLNAPAAVVLPAQPSDAYLPDLIEQLRDYMGSKRCPILVVRDAVEAEGLPALSESQWAAMGVYRVPTSPQAIAALLERLLLDREPAESRCRPQFPTRVVWPTARTSF